MEEFYQEQSETRATATNRDVIIVMAIRMPKLGQIMKVWSMLWVVVELEIENDWMFSEVCASCDLIIRDSISFWNMS
jgi:hypothetical protein